MYNMMGDRIRNQFSGSKCVYNHIHLRRIMSDVSQPNFPICRNWLKLYLRKGCVLALYWTNKS